MIRDWNAHNLQMDFSNVSVPTGRPSDIDMYYIVPQWYDTNKNFLILGEIKNEQGRFTDEQRGLYQQLIDSHSGGGAILYIVHNKRWQDGDKSVDVGNSKVESFYYLGKWRTPKYYSTVNQMIENLLIYEECRNV